MMYIVEMASCGMTKIHEDCYRHANSIRFCLRNMNGCNVSIIEGL
jgi:hypothetical protein